MAESEEELKSLLMKVIHPGHSLFLSGGIFQAKYYAAQNICFCPGSTDFLKRRASLRKLSPIGPYRQLDIVLDALPELPT